MGTPGFSDFIDYYEGELSIESGSRYFELMKAYIAAFSVYSQAYFHISNGIAGFMFQLRHRG